jgi:hypothetical protein
MLHSVLPKEGKWILSNDAHNTDIHIAVDEKIKNIQGSEVIKNALSGVIHTPAASVVPLNTASDATVIDGQGMGRIYNEDPQEGASE